MSTPPEPPPSRRRAPSGFLAMGLIGAAVVAWWAVESNVAGLHGAMDTPGAVAQPGPLGSTDAPSTTTLLPGYLPLVRFAEVDPLHLVVTYRAPAAPCTGSTGPLRILESDTAVTVTVEWVAPPVRPRACTHAPPVEEHTMTVALESTLGERAVLDGAQSRPVLVPRG